jgi:hypothetical protein
MPQQPAASTAELLGRLGDHDRRPRILQDFRPLHESLEWELSGAYYEQAGASAFTGGAVPFPATSNGDLSQSAAAVLFASVEAEASGDQPIRCLELGPGSGLFAKLLLDSFKRRCREQGRDYYDRLTLVLADRSQAMLDAIEAHRLLAEHEGRYELLHSDPERPAQAAAGPAALHAVFLNYVLDSLPASVLRRTEHGIEQLYVRICLERDATLSDYTPLTLERVVELAAARGGPRPQAGSHPLADLYPALVIDARYEPVAPMSCPRVTRWRGSCPSARRKRSSTDTARSPACGRSSGSCRPAASSWSTTSPTRPSTRPSPMVRPTRPTAGRSPSG